MKNTNDFSNIKVGDKLWSIQLGDCEVSTTHLQVLSAKSDSRKLEYYFNGRLHRGDEHQSLFWSNPNIQAPEKPEPEKTYIFTEIDLDAIWNSYTSLRFFGSESSPELKGIKEKHLNKDQ